MLILLAIGFLAGVVTAVSPCVLPVLPILLAGGASGRKPLRIVAGLVVSFSVFTLFAAWLLDQLDLPDDFLRNAAIVLLLVMAVTLLVPRAGLLIERPLAVFSRFRPTGVGGGFFFGATLGLVFVPCAGPVLATVTVVAANNSVGLRAILLTLAYAAGAALPMLLIARGGAAASGRLRRHAETVRVVSGALMAAVALGLVFHLDDNLATLTPGYTTFLQNKLENNSTAKRELSKVRGGGQALAAVGKTPKGSLPNYGVAPSLHVDGAWINSKPLTLAQLRGKVVLVDFWTYSCINCLRTLPHLKAWYAAYHDKGLVIIGVHTPEFAFEHVTSNVQAAVKRLGIAYPVMQDNDYKTWDNYANQYWPAEYLIDKTRPRSPYALRRRRISADRGADPQAARRQRLARPATGGHDADRSADRRELPRVCTIVELRRDEPGPERRPCLPLRAGHPAEHALVRRPVAHRCPADRCRAERPPAAPFPGEERLHRPRRTRHGPRPDQRQAGRHDQGRCAAPLHRSVLEQRSSRRSWSCASRPASRRIRSRSASGQYSRATSSSPSSFSRSRRKRVSSAAIESPDGRSASSASSSTRRSRS